MKIINIILPEWKIWTIGSLPEIRPSIVRMLLGGDVAIQTQPEVDLSLLHSSRSNSNI